MPRFFLTQQLDQDSALIRMHFRFQKSLKVGDVLGFDEIPKGVEALLWSPQLAADPARQLFLRHWIVGSFKDAMSAFAFGAFVRKNELAVRTREDLRRAIGVGCRIAHNTSPHQTGTLSPR